MEVIYRRRLQEGSYGRETSYTKSGEDSHATLGGKITRSSYLMGRLVKYSRSINECTVIGSACGSAWNYDGALCGWDRRHSDHDAAGA